MPSCSFINPAKLHILSREQNGPGKQTPKIPTRTSSLCNSERIKSTTTAHQTIPHRKLRFATSEGRLTLTDPDMESAMGLFDFAVRAAYEKRKDKSRVESHDANSFNNEMVDEQVVKERGNDKQQDAAYDSQERHHEVFQDSASGSDTMVAMSRQGPRTSIKSSSSSLSNHVSEVNTPMPASYIPRGFTNTENMNLEERGSGRPSSRRTRRAQHQALWLEDTESSEEAQVLTLQTDSPISLRLSESSPTSHDRYRRSHGKDRIGHGDCEFIATPETPWTPYSCSQKLGRDDAPKTEAREDFLDLLQESKCNEMLSDARQHRKTGRSTQAEERDILCGDPPTAPSSNPACYRAEFEVSSSTAELVCDQPSSCTKRVGVSTPTPTPDRKPSSPVCACCPDMLIVLGRLADCMEQRQEARTQVAAAIGRSAELQENIHIDFKARNRHGKW